MGGEGPPIIICCVVNLSLPQVRNVIRCSRLRAGVMRYDVQGVRHEIPVKTALDTEL